jgi:hypothetical protein
MMAAAASPSSSTKEDWKKNHNKLTRVVSTKLSKEDDDLLQHITTLVYQKGSIKNHPSLK